LLILLHNNFITQVHQIINQEIDTKNIAISQFFPDMILSQRVFIISGQFSTTSISHKDGLFLSKISFSIFASAFSDVSIYQSIFFLFFIYLGIKISQDHIFNNNFKTS
jgi:hypothetical protein